MWTLVQLFSFSITILRSIQVVYHSSFFAITENVGTARLHSSFTCSPADGYLNCFQFGALVNKAAVNIHT